MKNNKKEFVVMQMDTIDGNNNPMIIYAKDHKEAEKNYREIVFNVSNKLWIFPHDELIITVNGKSQNTH